jgi:hypothetical protein
MLTLRADVGVADVGQVVGLAAWPAAVLHLDEVADVHLVGEPASGRRRANGPMRAPAPIVAPSRWQKPPPRCRRRSCSRAARCSADAHAVGQMHAALEDAVHVDEHVGAHRQFAAHVEARRVGQRGAGVHRRRRGARLHHPLGLRQLLLAVHTERLVGVMGRRTPATRTPSCTACAMTVGQVVLALRVARSTACRASASAAAWARPGCRC